VIFLLDTDHVSLDQRGNPLVMAHIEAAGAEHVAISLITVEEQLRGWLAAIRSAKSSSSRRTAYARLRAAVEYFASITLIDYDLAADTIFEDLRHQGVRIGTQDLRIASVALAQNATLVTGNTRDFRLVPGLTTVDWSVLAS
jgi:tRNA(fMet)-specific endonuclease VapC